MRVPDYQGMGRLHLQNSRSECSGKMRELHTQSKHEHGK
ncbi:UNVERIFIED_ORG: hypothetical protein J3D59_004690 [Pseudomonas fluorescens]